MIRDSRTVTCDACGKKEVLADRMEGCLLENFRTGAPWRGENFHRCEIPTTSDGACYWCLETVDLCDLCYRGFQKVVRQFFGKGQAERDSK